MPQGDVSPEAISIQVSTYLPFNQFSQTYKDPTWEQFNPKAGESMLQWQTRVAEWANANPDAKDKNGISYASTVRQSIDPAKNRNIKQIKELWGTPTSGPTGPAKEGPLDRQKAIDDYYRMMMNPDAPELKLAQEQASAGMDRRTEGRGIGGGMGASAIAHAGMRARGELQMQRQGMAMGALQSGITSQNQMQGQVFNQNQGMQDRRNADEQRAIQAGISAGGQILSAGADLAKSGIGQGAGGGGTGPYGGYNSPASGMTNPYGGAGSSGSYNSPYGGGSASDWANPYGGY